GLFSPGHEDEVAHLLLDDAQAQRAIATATVDALVEQIPLLEEVRSGLDEAAFDLTKTERYAEAFQGAVDLAYEQALAPDGSAGRSVVLTLNDLVALLGQDSVPLLSGLDLGSDLGNQGVELVDARDLRRIRKVQDASHRWALPLLATGIVLAIAALIIPGHRGTRAISLGILIAAGAAVLFFTTGAVGSQLAARASQPAAGVVDALWVSAASSIRTWLGGAFMGGLLVVTIGFLVGAEHD
ncbi:MAG TPA: hypothetical protein VI341_09210, partial [Actinomycetota bacterium]